MTIGRCRKSLPVLSQFGAEVRAQIVLVHHLNKNTGTANIFNRLRGAGALHGWMEWGLAVTVINPEDEKESWVRRIELESKEVTRNPIHYRVSDGAGWLRLEETPMETHQTGRVPDYKFPQRGGENPMKAERCSVLNCKRPAAYAVFLYDVYLYQTVDVFNQRHRTCPVPLPAPSERKRTCGRPGS